MKLLLAALALGVAAPAAAQPVQAQAAPSAELDRLVRLLVPESTMRALAMKALDDGAAPADPAMQAYVAAQLRPEMTCVLQRELPALRSQIAAILAAELTPPEVADAATFFASPTGQKLYAAAIATIGANPGLTEEQAREAAMRAAMESLNAEDYPALIAFGASSASQKMGSINPQVAAASKAWATRLVGENGDRMRSLQLRAAEDYRKRAKP